MEIKQDPELFNGPQKPTWCSGCGNYGLFSALKKALAGLGLRPDKIMFFFGIGCSGNMCCFLRGAGFHSLHGRGIPVAIGAKICNPTAPAIVVAGDGDVYGEGMNHLLAAARGNHDIKVIVHNNMVYGLTTGQASPTSEKGFLSKSTPAGVIEYPVNPLSLVLSSGGTFVARGFTGEVDHLAEIFEKAIKHVGFSLIDVLQPCVTFNKVNTAEFYKSHVYQLQKKEQDFKGALEKASEWPQTHENADRGRIPIGIFWQKRQKAYHENLPQLKDSSLISQSIEKIKIEDVYPLYT